jgi:hypothetical protein
MTVGGSLDVPMRSRFNRRRRAATPGRTVVSLHLPTETSADLRELSWRLLWSIWVTAVCVVSLPITAAFPG